MALSAVAVAACSSGSGDKAPSGGSSAPAAVITIKDFGYGTPLTVAPGTTVTVKQEDSVEHDVFSNAFKTTLLGQGGTATFTAPSQPGTYEYTCSVHPRMHGQLIVQAGAGGSSTSDSGLGGY